MRICFWRGLFILLCLFGFFASAKDTFEIHLNADYMHSRLVRSDNSNSNAQSFSLVSQSSVHGELVLKQWLSRYFSLYLEGHYYQENYESSSSRTIRDPAPTYYDGGLGMELALGQGDIVFFIEGMVQQVPVLIDETSVIHDLKAAPMNSFRGGFKLQAYSRQGFEIETKLFGGGSAGETTFEGAKLALNSVIGARGTLSFGRTSGAGTAALKYSGFSNMGFRYGLNVGMKAEEYTYNQISYNLTHFQGGLFCRLLF